MSGNDKLLYADYDKNNTGINFSDYHCHKANEIYILKHGERTIVIDDTMYRTSGHDAAMIKSYSLHRSFGDTPYSGICINFTDEYLGDYFSKTAIEYLMSAFEKPVIRLTEENFTKIYEFAEKIMKNKQNKFVYLADILDILISSHTDTESSIIDIPRLNPVIEYISSNYAHINSLDDVSEAMHINKNYLCGVFKKKTGMTVSSYINLLRVRAACSMLTAGDDTLEDIGEKCGFGSTSYFCRTFKKLLGCTPGEFRQGNRKKSL